MFKYLNDKLKLVDPIIIGFTLKLAVLATGVFVLVGNVLFWTFESGYLGAFGLWSELIDRELFESDFSVVWFLANMLNPVLWGGVAIVVLLFILSLGQYFIVFWRRRTVQSSSGQIGMYPFNYGRYRNLDQKKADFFGDICVYTVYVFGVFFIGVLLLVSGVKHFSEKGRDIAEKQILAFVKYDLCLDEVTNRSLGCYSSKLFGNEEILLITNGDREKSYLSKSDSRYKECKFNVYLNVSYVTLGEKLVRPYYPRVPNEALKGLICVPDGYESKVKAVKNS